MLLVLPTIHMIDALVHLAESLTERKEVVTPFYRAIGVTTCSGLVPGGEDFCPLGPPPAPGPTGVTSLSGDFDPEELEQKRRERRKPARKASKDLHITQGTSALTEQQAAPRTLTQQMAHVVLGLTCCLSPRIKEGYGCQTKIPSGGGTVVVSAERTGGMGVSGEESTSEFSAVVSGWESTLEKEGRGSLGKSGVDEDTRFPATKESPVAGDVPLAETPVVGQEKRGVAAGHDEGPASAAEARPRPLPRKPVTDEDLSVIFYLAEKLDTAIQYGPFLSSERMFKAELFVEFVKRVVAEGSSVIQDFRAELTHQDPCGGVNLPFLMQSWEQRCRDAAFRGDVPSEQRAQSGSGGGAKPQESCSIFISQHRDNNRRTAAAAAQTTGSLQSYHRDDDHVGTATLNAAPAAASNTTREDTNAQPENSVPSSRRELGKQKPGTSTQARTTEQAKVLRMASAPAGRSDAFLESRFLRLFSTPDSVVRRTSDPRPTAPQGRPTAAPLGRPANRSPLRDLRSRSEQELFGVVARTSGHESPAPPRPPNSFLQLKQLGGTTGEGGYYPFYPPSVRKNVAAPRAALPQQHTTLHARHP